MTNDLRDGLALALCRKQCSMPTLEGLESKCTCPDPESDPDYPICIQWIEMADACLAFLRRHFARDDVVDRAADAIGTLILKRKAGLTGLQGAKMLAEAALQAALAPIGGQSDD